MNQQRWREAAVICAGILLVCLCPFPWLLAFLLLFLFFACAFWNTPWSVFFIIFLTPLSRVPFTGNYTDWLRLLLLFLVAAAWLLRKPRDKRYLFRQNPFNLYFAVFTVLVIVNFFLAENDEFWYSIAAVHLVCFVYYYFFMDFFRKRFYLQSAIFVFIGVSAAVGTLAIMQYFVLHFSLDIGPLQRFVLPETFREQLRYPLWQRPVPLNYRSVGTFFHPNPLGIYLSAAFPLCLALSGTTIRKFYRFFISIVLFLLAGAIFTSGSRGAFVSIFASTLFLLIFFNRLISKTTLFALVAGIAGLTVYLYGANPVYFRLGQLLSHREVIWQNSLQLFMEHPFTGLGLGSFSSEYFSRFGFPSLDDFYVFLPEIRLAGEMSVLQNGFHAHNMFLHYAVELGVAGGVMAVAFYGLIGRLFYDGWKNREQLRVLDLGITAGGIASFVGNFTYCFSEGITLFNHLPIAMTVIFILSAIAAVRPQALPQYRKKPESLPN